MLQSSSDRIHKQRARHTLAWAQMLRLSAKFVRRSVWLRADTGEGSSDRGSLSELIPATASP
eukprot:6214829-Pleurochrysis_carterae.AAC.4